MYENYSYEQVKNLPDDQKVIALKEFKAIYPENKVLAQHWDVAHIAVSNMVGKYLEGKQVGRKKMTPEEKAQAKLQREREKELGKQQVVQRQEEKIENGKQDIQNETSNAISYASIVTTTPNPVNQVIEENQIKPKSNSFSIRLDKNMTGEEAINRLNGISNSLLKDNEYTISLVIEEV